MPSAVPLRPGVVEPPSYAGGNAERARRQDGHSATGPSVQRCPPMPSSHDEDLYGAMCRKPKQHHHLIGSPSPAEASLLNLRKPQALAHCQANGRTESCTEAWDASSGSGETYCTESDRDFMELAKLIDESAGIGVRGSGSSAPPSSDQRHRQVDGFEHLGFMPLAANGMGDSASGAGRFVHPR